MALEVTNVCPTCGGVDLKALFCEPDEQSLQYEVRYECRACGEISTVEEIDRYLHQLATAPEGAVLTGEVPDEMESRR